MTACIIVIVISSFLFLLCRVAVKAPSAGNVRQWVWSMLGTFLKLEDFNMVKKIFVCMAIMSAVLLTCAYAEDDNVVDVEETDEPVVLSETTVPDADTESDNTGDPDSTGVPADAGPDDTINQNEEEEIHPQEGTPQPVTDVVETSTPEPTSTPELTDMTVEEQTLDTLGHIYGLLIFFTVVTLCYFSYKFLRIFF